MRPMSERQVDLKFFDMNGKEFLFITGQRVAFFVEKKMQPIANHAVFGVFELDETTEKHLITTAKHLEAYIKSVKIFSGDIAQIHTTDSTDFRRLALSCVDCDTFFYSRLAASIMANSTLEDLARVCVMNGTKPAKMGRISSLMRTVRLPRGAVLAGRAIDRLKEAARQVEATVYVLNGFVNIVRPDENLEVVFGLENKHLRAEASIDGSNALFTVDLGLSVDIGQAFGFGGDKYRCKSISMTGDTKGGDWQAVIGAEKVLEN